MPPFVRGGGAQEIISAKSYNKEMELVFLEGREDIELLDGAVRRILVQKFQLGLFENPFGETGEITADTKQEESETALTSALESLVLVKNDGILPLEDKISKIGVVGYHAGAIRALFGGYTYMAMTESMLGAQNTMAGIQQSPSVKEEEAKYSTYGGTVVHKEHPEAERLAKEIIPGQKNLLEEITECWGESEIQYAYGYPYAGEDCGFHEREKRRLWSSR